MDLDTTIKDFTLTHESICEIIRESCTVEIANNAQFELMDISDIRDDELLSWHPSPAESQLPANQRTFGRGCHYRGCYHATRNRIHLLSAVQ